MAKATFPTSVRSRLPIALLAVVLLLNASALRGQTGQPIEDPPPGTAPATEPAPVVEPAEEPEPEVEREADAEPEAEVRSEPEVKPDAEVHPGPGGEPPVPPDPGNLPLRGSELAPEAPLAALADASSTPEVAASSEALPQAEGPPETPPLAALDDASASSAAATSPEPGNGKRPNPCKQPATFKEAWLDKVRRGVFYTVCGSAAWFDNFFGDEHVYDQRQVYGRISGGVLHDAEGDWNERSKFDANIPLPNLMKRGTAFLGRDNPEQFISDTSQDLSTPEAFRDGTDDRSWLAGFGYNPPGRRGSRMSYRLGVKVSTDPYVFGQARYRYTKYWANDTALRFYETLFYRTNDDQFGATTYIGYDWIPRRANLARISAQGTVSEDTEGLKWKSYATLYHDLERMSGKPRGIAYQLLANGETEEDVPLREYGFLAVYREQMFREWFFTEVSLGYSWIREELVEDREGGITVGFVFEIRFGDYYDRR